MSLGYGRFIKGQFYVREKTSPDGDSMRFIPDDPTLFQTLHGYQEPDLKNQDPWNLQLRFEAIDTPELHYGGAKQPHGIESRNGLLTWLGEDPKDWDWEVAPAAFEWTKPGGIVCSGFEAHGRPISFVLNEEGASKLQDGADTKVDDVLKLTYNYHAAATGNAYLGFYDKGVSWTTRSLLIGAMKEAREAKKGIWKFDSTSRFKVETLEDISESGALIYPKLFRRCVDALKSFGGLFQSGQDLDDWLAEKGDENDLMLVYTTDGGKIKQALRSVIAQINNTIRVSVDLNTVDFISK
ncbi:hypothetical protein [Prosthecobacter vanneervenii]|uniref:Endonuclease YncB(Thermonuclease family) n=1 Tax=Prosthecobacter vanneervenii TaxID=48466 RepID=A0A7W7Y8F0_9BACT|nr:hypothetical protein [Prosthecobacter vanneervenii]MBB5031479.1 endonuclease YncB(thermonuclease family) [Prosthecobacter vanneervenii]